MNDIDRLAKSAERGDDLAVIHYACENLHQATDHPPAVSCIVVRPLGGGATQLFSRTHAPPGTEDSDIEIGLLTRYLEYVQANAGTQFIHWNMARATYGFRALENRYRYLTGEAPYQVPDSSVHDLDDLVQQRYGDEYATHPKLATLAGLNGMSARYALPGGEEADRAVAGDFGAIDRSAEEKVLWIQKIFQLLIAGELDTLNSVGSIDFAHGSVDAVGVVVTIGRKLLYVERELLNRYGSRSAMDFNDEYDDQDLFRSLLRMFFDDVRPEEYSPSYAGGSTRMDFLLPTVGIAIELKHTSNKMTSKDVAQQLTIDATWYAKHPDARHLVCVVVDHDGHLKNPRGLEQDLARDARTDGLAVTVAIIDR